MAPASNPLPKYVYKILDSAPPEPIPAIFPPSELDQKDGFIHLSTSDQIPRTADLFFAQALAFWLVKIELEGLAYQPIEWEGEGCVHLYGKIRVENVISSKKFERSEGQKWSESLRTSSWLE